MDPPGGSAVDPRVRHELMCFRVPELQQVAQRLGLRKTGRKGELQARILAFFGDSSASVRTSVLGPSQQFKIEQAAKIISEVYSRMMKAHGPPSDQSAHTQQRLPAGGAQVAAPAPAAARAAGPAAYLHQAASQAFLTAYRQQAAQPPAAAAAQQQQQQQQQQHIAANAVGRQRRVRCLCQSDSELTGMAQCRGKGCGVWQHTGCLGLAAPPVDHLCEQCRSHLADPFWEATTAVLGPARLRPQSGRPPVVTTAGMQEVQCAERVFYLNQQQLEAVHRDPQNNRLQVCCVEVGDEVPLRFHWPKYVDLKVNNLPHRPYGRALNSKMGINQRDDVASIGMMVVRGRNVLSMSAADSGVYVITLSLARRRSLDQVKALMAAPEGLEAAAARVRRQLGGGGDDGGSDDELLVSHQVVSLKDPMSGQRMQVPARFTDASGLQAFDLDSFLSMVERNRKWQDPSTLKNSSVEQLQVDSYIQRVLLCLRGQPLVEAVEVSAEGRWRPEGSSGPWHDVTADPDQVAASLAAAAAGPTSQPADAAAAAAGAGAAVKPDPDGGGGGGGGGGEVLVSDSEGEEDEATELRRAAEAVRRKSAAALAALAGQKRKAAEPEVVDLLSSDDEEPPQRAYRAPQASQPPAAAPPAGTPAAGQQAAQAGQQKSAASPLRIRLPVRPRPGGGPPAAGGGSGGVSAARQPASLPRVGAPQVGMRPSLQRQPPAAAAGSRPAAQPRAAAAAGAAPAQQPYAPPAPLLAPADLFHGHMVPGGGLPGFLPASQLPGVPAHLGMEPLAWLGALAGGHPALEQQHQLQALGGALDLGYRGEWETDNDLQALFEDD